MTTPDVLQRITILPVRHHSPVAARMVERALREERPRLVLIEGPSDANHMIPLLLQPDTRPPVAILSYRPATDGTEPRRMVDPFCDYSPELVAMRVASEIGADIRFFDAPATAWFDVETQRPDGNAEQLPENAAPDLYLELAERFGFASHEEFWDTRIEMADPTSVAELIGSYGEMVRDWLGEHNPRAELDTARDAWMVQEIHRACEEGYLPEEIAIVCGAAHVRGIRSGVQAPGMVERLRKAAPARFALIPYSYPRLSEQSGYGAGNRAPAFYQEVWLRKGDWNTAARSHLVKLVDVMRTQGYAVSLADAIEAERLATNLAGMRDKPAIGVEEIRDAALACYGRGTDTPAIPLWRLMVGEEVGTVTSTVARTSLQQEFLDGVKRYGIPFSDRPRDIRLNLTSPGERGASAFLHRLCTAGVPFATIAATGTGRRDENPDSLERLMVLREKWEVCWIPSTDIRLIELGVYGNSIAEVCTRLLRKRMDEARGLAAMTAVLLDAAVGHLEGLYDEVLAACEKASSDDDDFPGTARAAYLLDVLTGYSDLPGRVELLALLSERVFSRACLLLPGAADASDEEAARVCEGMKQLHHVAARRRQRGENPALLVERFRMTAAGGEKVSPLTAGLASAVLYLDGDVSDDELARGLGLRISRGEEPMRAAQFVEGLFSLNRSVLVRNRAIVGSLTSFLCEIEREQFLAVLPVLRRSLAGLSTAEMGYLVSTIVEALGIAPGGEEAPVLEASQLADLAGLDAEIGDLFA